jgi:S1-C subfamily serine protease
MPADDTPVQVVEAAEGGSSKALIAVVALLAAGGVGYFIASRNSAPAAVTAPAEETDEAAADAPAGTVSAERRAWDAAASAARSTPAPLASDAPAPASVPAAAGLSGALEDMVDRVMPAIVLVETTRGRGSAFYVRHDTLITNVHVVQEDGYVTLRKSDGTSVTARVENKAPAFDIAVLKVATPSPSQKVISMGSARGLKPGQEIIVIGSALGTLRNSVSRGIVSGIRSSGGATLVQTDAATNPGNSGGPMLDRNGYVIGIVTMGYRNAEGLNFAVAIDHAVDILDGKPVNLGTQTGLTEIQSNARDSAPSESERRQAQGEQEFRGRVARMADAGRNFDAAWQRFRSQCFKSPIPGSYNREWFVVMTPQGLPGGSPPGCPAYYDQMTDEIGKFRELMRETIQDARRANVLPGTVRDVLRSNKLEFDWER